MSDKVPILVLLGADSDSKWHASRFEQTDAALVTRAAGLMGFYVLRVTADQDEAYGIAEALPVGKIFASGKAFVPFVAREAFENLRILVEDGAIFTPPTDESPAPAQPTAAMLTDEGRGVADALWSKIEVGTTVLAAQPDLYGPGWWEGIVVGVDGDGLTIRWVDEAAPEPIHVSRRDVGLRHPGAD